LWRAFWLNVLALFKQNVVASDARFGRKRRDKLLQMILFPEFSRLLTQYLAQRDRSPAWLARRLRVHRATVSRWLNEATRPATPELVIRVADVLGVYTPAERGALLAAAGFAYQEGAVTVVSGSVTAGSAAVDAKPIDPPPQAMPAMAQQPRSKLPITSKSFVGRERELAQIAERLADPVVRLITIVGLGGMGKSRLAVEAGVRMLDHFVDGVWFVALASVTSAGLIPATIAAVLEMPSQGAIDLEAHILRYLGDKRLLLILDNLEQLLDGVHIIERILEGAPGVKVLATSRVRLRLDPEWLFPLDGLTVPPSTDFSMLAAAEYTAVDLFVQRARRLQPDFTLSLATSAEVIRICRLVGGMPLAIELAVAWLRFVPLAEIAGEIQANLDFLATSMRNEFQRHRNIRAVFDHSWQLLGDRERHTLMYASVFRGGFTRQAAAEVANADLPILSGLVDSSWIQLNAQGRYEIHELARQYAEEKLDAKPSTANHARAAHCAYYAALADERSSKLKILVVELDNIWAGWYWATANRDFDKIEKFVNALGWLADAHGLYGEVVGEYEKVCALAREKLADVSISVASYSQIALELARLLSDLCYLYGRAISVERGLARGAESVELLRQLELDGRSGEVSPFYLEALVKMSIVTGFHADYQAARLYCDEIMRLTRGKDEHLEFYGDALNTLGQVASLQGNFAEAERYLTECLAQAPGDGIRNAATDRLAHAYADIGNLAHAAQFAKAAIITAEESGNRPAFASALLAKAEVAMAQGHFEEAEKYFGHAYAIAEETGNRHVRGRFLTGKARLARLLGRPVEAQQLFQQAYELAKSMGRNKDVALAQVGLGFALLDQEEGEAARTCFRAALQVAWQRRIMPEVIWAVVGLAALKGFEGQLQIAARWLRSAVAHPCCPKRIQGEAEEISKRLALAEIPHALDEELLQAPDTILEGIVLELLR
jgi:predicted ATPase/tetratricopeptide (TPR) repeat protein